MTRTELIEETRAVLTDIYAAYAWSDDRLIRWLSAAQDNFCSRTGFFRDTSTYSIITQNGVASYPIDSRIIRVDKVFLVNAQLPKMTTKVVRGAASISPSAWTTEHETGKLTLSAPADGVYTLSLETWRKSVYALTHKTANAYDKDPEIPEDFHYGLVMYAVAEALKDLDRETNSKSDSDEYMGKYLQYVRDGRKAFYEIHGLVIDAGCNPAYTV